MCVCFSLAKNTIKLGKNCQNWVKLTHLARALPYIYIYTHTHLSLLSLSLSFSFSPPLSLPPSLFLQYVLGGFKSLKRSFSLEPNNLLAINLAIRAAFETAILSVWFRALSVRFRGFSVRFRGISVGFRLLLITKWNAGLVANWIAGPGGVLKRVALEPTQSTSVFLSVFYFFRGISGLGVLDPCSWPGVSRALQSILTSDQGREIRCVGCDGTWQGKSSKSENSRRLWLFPGSLQEFCRKVPGKLGENCWKMFPESRNATNSRISGTAQRALRDILMPHGKNWLPTVSRQFLTLNYPRQNCLLGCLPNCFSPTREDIFSSFKIAPVVRVISRQLSGKNCLAAIFASRHQDASPGPLGGKGKPVGNLGSALPGPCPHLPSKCFLKSTVPAFSSFSEQGASLRGQTACEVLLGFLRCGALLSSTWNSKGL